ncbi:MAG: DUF192 domain-containing protein [Cyanobacteria bacterium SID2]|nr:DUF192 domain-containing protein [Cyanobacteria bacterium SID2]MBP0002217.1 DUF192 domain-containing protein [Cyanobacteria bacterium SBC]
MGWIAVVLSSIVVYGCSSETIALSQKDNLDRSVPVENAPTVQPLPLLARARVGDRWIALEVARTPQQQAQGLMYRDSIDDDRGMLFPFEPPQPVQFWMKNVRIDLDMIFLYEGEVVGIAENVPPCRTARCPTYSPGAGVLVDNVIELRGGRASELGVSVGDRVEIEFLDEPLS